MHESLLITALASCGADIDTFWISVATNVNMQQEVPLERWDLEEKYHPSMAHPGLSSYARFGAFCQGKASLFAFKRPLMSHLLCKHVRHSLAAYFCRD